MASSSDTSPASCRYCGPSTAGEGLASPSSASHSHDGANIVVTSSSSDNNSNCLHHPPIPVVPPFLFGLPQRKPNERRPRKNITPWPTASSHSQPKVPASSPSQVADSQPVDAGDYADPYEKISTSDMFDCDLIDHAHGHVPGDIPASTGTLPPPCSCCGKLLGSCQEFISGQVDLAYKIYQTGAANQDGIRIPLQQPMLRPIAWANYLHSYWDCQPILDGLVYGWDIGIVGSPRPVSAPRNHPSAKEFLDDVHHYIESELAHGCIIGPLDRRKLPFPVSVCPLGAVPKQGSDRRRIITDCTFSGKGINQWIPQRWYRGQYWKISLPTVESIVALIKRVRQQYPGQKIMGFKMDLSRYFRNLFIDPGQSPYLAILVDRDLFLDLVFSYGNRGAMVAAQRLSDAICWIFRTQIPPSPDVANSGQDCRCSGPCDCGSNSMVDYVDDFIAIVPEETAQHLWDCFSNLISELGLRPSLTPGHLVPPSTSFIGLGILFDLDNNTLSIPPEKLAATLQIITLWLRKLEASKQELQSLLGKILHVCRVVRSGRLMLSRMLETYRRCIKAGKPIRLDNEFGLDLRWWAENLSNWNGISFLEFQDFDNKVALDASTNGATDGGPGLGGFNFMSNQWFKTTVPNDCKDWSVADL